MHRNIRRLQKIIKIGTGIFSFLYFMEPIIGDVAGWQIRSGFLFDFLFVAALPYNYLCSLFQHWFILRCIGQLMVFLLGWLVLFLLFRAIYEMIFDIYLDKQRFRLDEDEDDID